MYKLHLEVAAILPQTLISIEPNIAKIVVTYLFEKIRYRGWWLEGFRGEFARSLSDLIKFEYPVGGG
jgi:hypothetical protein